MRRPGTSLFSCSVLDGKRTRVLPRDFQIHPFRPRAIAINWLRYRVGAYPGVKLEIPLKSFNEERCPCLREGGWMLELIHKVRWNTFQSSTSLPFTAAPAAHAAAAPARCLLPLQLADGRVSEHAEFCACRHPSATAAPHAVASSILPHSSALPARLLFPLHPLCPLPAADAGLRVRGGHPRLPDDGHARPQVGRQDHGLRHPDERRHHAGESQSPSDGSRAQRCALPCSRPQIREQRQYKGIERERCRDLPRACEFSHQPAVT